MFAKKRLMRQAALFDGEAIVSPPGFSHGDDKYATDLLTLHRAAQASASQTPDISDGQFDAFMAGIRESLAEPVRPAYPFWTTVSVAAAALVIAVALLSILYPGSEPVKANTVESVSTDLNGATVDWYDNKEGVTTVWVKSSGDDVW